MDIASVSLGDVKAPSEEIPQIGGWFDGDRLLVPLLTSNVSAVSDQLRVATTLARKTDTSLQVINPVPGPRPDARGVPT